MRYRTIFTFIIFSLFLSACVSQPITVRFNKQQAAKARIELGLGYLKLRNFSQAKLNFDKALFYQPDYYLVHSAFAYLYQLQGDISQAKSSYEKAISLDKSQGDVKNNYGAFLCSQGEFARAYELFEQALTTPNYYQQADTYANIIICAEAEHNIPRYQKFLQLLKNIDPKRAEEIKKVS
ncbi:type IV pilus biogenesis/stability protein PilW [Histophilus somni]|uniref:Type IV pilus biogenesis/stability protein PilW n=1 Tax=Histophilus somni TaxID=731 RepID=A0A9Q6Z0N3_HISSO|nr:type IV pilus biogenesis/stability protein PilW [Histophilus somni]ARU64546.1 type IV pilus biogenesis/stability protein PilW [Histophilus somni]ARU66331.1 type IV pilus biogenesis/stability protein PilW [Histophilus somni]ARU68206.1 type IV pilus biogenesis/stability protein PilW [Histophilus somni]ARU70087.1 type IV pilus biogenesis/stability protein PilW [Histophilus somni]ARU71961.1 type IV pilus biogenesis/stability protein PilW [Histophilus somni]